MFPVRTPGLHEADAASQPRTEKEKTLVQAMDELKHHVIRYYEGWPQKVKAEPYFKLNSRTDGKIQ